MTAEAAEKMISKKEIRERNAFCFLIYVHSVHTICYRIDFSDSFIVLTITNFSFDFQERIQGYSTVSCDIPVSQVLLKELQMLHASLLL